MTENNNHQSTRQRQKTRKRQTMKGREKWSIAWMNESEREFSILPNKKKKTLKKVTSCSCVGMRRRPVVAPPQHSTEYNTLANQKRAVLYCSLSSFRFTVIHFLCSLVSIGIVYEHRKCLSVFNTCVFKVKCSSVCVCVCVNDGMRAFQC